MVGKVFISCGQASKRERETANNIKEMLMQKFHLDSYIAVNIQGFNDIMRITDELKRSDYFLFIDFLRKETRAFPISLFTHQELALAQNVGFADMIALREKGTPVEGFLKYIQSNPLEFENDEDLVGKTEELVGVRGWNREYSRNLVLSTIDRVGPLAYRDQTCAHAELECVWQARILNRRPDVAAINTICIVDSFGRNGVFTESLDRGNLKWARQMGYERTILPLDYGIVDVISVRRDYEGLFLHSALDWTPRDPIIDFPGTYIIRYKVFSQNFPVLEFAIEVDYHYSMGPQDNWQNNTTARIIPFPS